jgi:SAM-dependent methyltransferase
VIGLKMAPPSNSSKFLLLALVVIGAAAFYNRGHIYDMLIVHMTKQWYALVLTHIPDHARVLDIGVGTAAALLHNAATILQKQTHWVGIDYDLQYIVHARQLLAAQPLTLQKMISLHHVSVYDYPVTPITNEADRFDVAYFSSSLMIMPDPVKALQHVTSLLKPDGFIIVTQTIEAPNSRSPFMLRLIETIKPFAKYLLTIDFGQITTEPAFYQTVAAAGLTVAHDEPIWNDGSLAGNGKSRFFKLVRNAAA